MIIFNLNMFKVISINKFKLYIASREIDIKHFDSFVYKFSKIKFIFHNLGFYVFWFRNKLNILHETA
jgi:hypothetical protein